MWPDGLIIEGSYELELLVRKSQLDQPRTRTQIWVEKFEFFDAFLLIYMIAVVVLMLFYCSAVVE
jgi:hypothetical protein